MGLLPSQTETISSKLSPAQIEKILSSITAAPTLKINKTARHMVFQGKVGNLSFIISQRISHPNNFVPLVRGIIEPTRNGSIIFLKYMLFRSSVMFLIIALLMSAIIGVSFLAVNSTWTYSAIAFALGFANYLVTLLNFQKQVRITRNLLLEALNID